MISLTASLSVDSAITTQIFFLSADGMTYSFGVFYAEFLTYFNEGKGKTAWIISILVGVTLSSGIYFSIMVS